MAMEPPEVHPAHKAHGANWLEWTVSLAALLTSAVSIFIAVRHGETMEKLVAANSYPYVEIVSGNVGDWGSDTPAQFLLLRNPGVGPAKVEHLSVTYGGRVMHSLNDLAAACCTPAERAALHGAWTVYQQPRRFIPARGDSHVFEIRSTPQNAVAWRKFGAVREKLRVEACYCSVFDECYTVNSDDQLQKPAKSCPIDPATNFVP